MIPTETQLRAQYQNASRRVQQFITSVELDEIFKEIHNTHKLHLDEIGNLSNALNAVFLEMAPLEQFPNLLKEALEQNSDRYDAVLKDVNEKIFVAFRKKLEEPEEPSIEEKTVPETVVPTPPPQASQIDALEKTVSFNDTPPTIEKTAPAPIDKLETSVREKPTEVEIEKPKPNTSGSAYTGSTDPYREPIE